ncbi:Retrovirus-related Pol polyprotein from transposon TNT 1-94 [Senna tora]|uniref:Retrovirus-related Pol polyprotein from transposon TNT 1-94 n=1 Tax=Senna tora TaxID=362788 RepID=A0A835C454_9FABA|nr:Retrovirus-related Pol polyprotein from transposon TNT 1-94 [Senna tora]
MSSRNTVVFGTMASTVDNREIHGKPPNWQPRSRSSAAHHVETTVSQPFNQNQIEFLQKLFVKIADGSMVKVSGIGSVKTSANLTLLNVLHVPILTCNLLSVIKLTRDNHCAANFKSHGCSFQDLASGMMIGSAKECSDQIETQTQPIESPRQMLTSHDKRHETHTTPMMQTEAEIPRPSPGNTENSDEDMNFPIALRKGLADILTKSLCDTKFEELSAKLGMINIMSAA